MLNSLKKRLESEKKDEDLFDIVIYGSITKGSNNPRDIDLLAIFLKGSLRERLDKLQKIKSKLSDHNIDAKQILLKDLFLDEFLARTGIFLEGISLFKDKKFSETLGFRPYALFSYGLKGLTHTEKVKFNYILSGRNVEGVLKQLGGIRVASAVIKVPIQNSLIFEEILKANKVNYLKKNLLEEI